MGHLPHSLKSLLDLPEAERTLGPFRLVAPLGRGGFAPVWLAKEVYGETELRTVAVKLFSLEASDKTAPSLSGSPYRASVIDEARALCRVEHPNVVRFYALPIDEARGVMGLAMEHIDGMPLDRRLREAGKLSTEETLALGAAVASALAAVHGVGLIHRDVKPANVVEADGIYKLIDFGIAAADQVKSVVIDDDLPFEVTKPLAAGTLGYVDPVCVVTGEAATPASDLYSLGATLFQCLTGKLPCAAGRSDGIDKAVIEGRKPAIRLLEIAPDVPAPLAGVIDKMLAPDRGDRPRSARWVAIELGRLRSVLAEPIRPLASQQITPLSRSSDLVELEGDLARLHAPQSTTPIFSGENRICTVMIVDLSRAVASSARLDPSEVKDLLDRCQRALAEPIEALGGYADRRGMDGAIGVFGALRASEGDAERAVHAAIRLQAALAKVRLPKGARGVRPSARIGISTGRVFAEVADGAVARGFIVIGEAVTSATRLQKSAAPGAIVIGRDTSRQIAGRFNIEPLLPVAAAGEDEPIPAFRVLGPVPLRHGLSPQDFHGVGSKLVGRGPERQRLLDALDTITQEQRAAQVTLVGPPGVGRSRMLAEVVSVIAVAEQTFILSAAQGSALAVSTSYGLATALIRGRFEIPDGAPPEVILHRLRRGVRWMRARLSRVGRDADRPAMSDPLENARDAVPTGQDLDDALIQIAGLLDTRTAAPGGAITPDEDGSRRKHRLTAAVACLVRFAASLAPVVVLCDDAQWADDASLDLLEDLVFRVEDLPVLVVCAARPELYERRATWGEGSATHRRVDLARLDRRHVEEMARDRLHQVRELSSDFVRTVADRAEGNPLILDETLRLLVDVGVIEVPGDGGAWAVHDLDLGALALPATVQGIVQARLDRLDPPSRALIMQAAVVGKTFWESVVEELRLSAESIAVRPNTAEIIADLRERQLVRAREATTFPGERERVFAESATQEVAYEMLPARVRRPLHLLVAKWLKKRAPGNAGAALVALHYDLGGDARAAVEEYDRAAAHASSLGQNADARRFLLRLCELYAELEEEAGSDGTPEVPWRDRVRVRLDLGDVLRRIGRLDEAEVEYGRARAGIPVAEPEAPRWEARVDFRLALSFKVRGSTAAARELVERAIALAKEGRIPEETPAMYALLTFLYRRERKHAESWKTSLEGLRVCRSLRRSDDRFRESAARALLGLAPVLYSCQRWIPAERTYRQAARIAAGTRELDLLGRALNGVAASLLARGDHPGARATFLESLRVKQKAGDLHQIAVAYVNLAELAVAMGEPAAALDHARRSIRLAEQVHADSDLGEMYRNLGAALLDLGQIDAAIDACLHALQIAEKKGQLYLPGIVETLTKACERAVALAPAGSALPAKVVEAEHVIEAMGEQSFVDVALRARIDDLRALLEALLA